MALLTRVAPDIASGRFESLSVRRYLFRCKRIRPLERGSRFPGRRRVRLARFSAGFRGYDFRHLVLYLRFGETVDIGQGMPKLHTRRSV